VLDGLFHIAGADGVVTAGELEYLERVCALFELSPLTFRRMKATHLGLAAGDPYAVLDVPADASDEAVHTAWRQALIETHPDKVIARGLPSEYVDVALAKAKALNVAFDAVTRERRAMTAAH